MGIWGGVFNLNRDMGGVFNLNRDMGGGLV